jgi:hypothetical protein
MFIALFEQENKKLMINVNVGRYNHPCIKNIQEVW